MQKFRKKNIYLNEEVKKILKEVHFSDYYGENFVEFRKKYTKLIKNNEITPYLYYVNFTNNPSFDTLSTSFNENPDHSDPAGIYGYPLQYVLKNPMDIWYGNSMKNLRVLKIKGRPNYLSLQYIDENKLYNDFRKIYSRNEIEKLVNIYQKNYKNLINNKSRNIKWGLTYLGLIQMNLNKPEENTSMFSTSNYNYPTYSSLEQRETLLKLGYDVIIDEGRNAKTSILNDREPEQILILNSQRVKIVDIYKLHGINDQSKVGSEATINLSTSRHKTRKLASFISEKILGSKLTSSKPYNTSMNGWNYFFNTNGETIGIYPYSISYPSDSTRGFGEKIHKRDSIYIQEAYKVKLTTKYGEIQTSIDYKEKLKTLINNIKDSYKSLVSNPEENYTFKPYNYETFKDKVKEERYAYYEKQKYNENLKYIKGTKENVQNLINKFNIDFVLPDSEKDLINLVELEENFYNLFVRASPKTKDEFKDLFNTFYKVSFMNEKEMYKPYYSAIKSIILNNYTKLNTYNSFYDFTTLLKNL